MVDVYIEHRVSLFLLIRCRFTDKHHDQLLCKYTWLRSERAAMDRTTSSVLGWHVYMCWSNISVRFRRSWFWKKWMGVDCQNVILALVLLWETVGSIDIIMLLCDKERLWHIMIVPYTCRNCLIGYTSNVHWRGNLKLLALHWFSLRFQNIM